MKIPGSEKQSTGNTSRACHRQRDGRVELHIYSQGHVHSKFNSVSSAFDSMSREV